MIFSAVFFKLRHETANSEQKDQSTDVHMFSNFNQEEDETVQTWRELLTCKTMQIALHVGEGIHVFY